MAGLGVPGVGPANSPYEPKNTIDEDMSLLKEDIIHGKRVDPATGNTVGGWDPDLGILPAVDALRLAGDEVEAAMEDWEFAKRYLEGLQERGFRGPQVEAGLREHVAKLKHAWGLKVYRWHELRRELVRKKDRFRVLRAASEKYPHVQRKRKALPPHPGDPKKRHDDKPGWTNQVGDTTRRPYSFPTWRLNFET
jgi:hypothetical protein